MSAEREARIAEYRQAQPVEELERKARKAISRSDFWQQEEIDLIKVRSRELRELCDSIEWE